MDLFGQSEPAPYHRALGTGGQGAPPATERCLVKDFTTQAIFIPGLSGRYVRKRRAEARLNGPRMVYFLGNVYHAPEGERVWP